MPLVILDFIIFKGYYERDCANVISECMQMRLTKMPCEGHASRGEKVRCQQLADQQNGARGAQTAELCWLAGAGERYRPSWKASGLVEDPLWNGNV